MKLLAGKKSKQKMKQKKLKTILCPVRCTYKYCFCEMSGNGWSRVFMSVIVINKKPNCNTLPFFASSMVMI